MNLQFKLKNHQTSLRSSSREATAELQSPTQGFSPPGLPCVSPHSILGLGSAAVSCGRQGGWVWQRIMCVI